MYGNGTLSKNRVLVLQSSEALCSQLEGFMLQKNIANAHLHLLL